MKFNKYTFIGFFIGLIVGCIAFIPIFGIVFGITFFVVNAILSLFKLIHSPNVMPFFYSGIITGLTILIGFSLIGAYKGTKYGESKNKAI